jgi:glycosyltransferase involved in cell wall biosynthesis
VEHPTVSVVIPCYNSGSYIIEAVESARKQQGNFILNEVIVIDDCSDDSATQNALKEINGSQRVKVVPSKFSKGPSGARNTGIDMVQSDWTAFLDADDILLPNSIAARIDALARNPQIKWCGGDFVKLYPDGSHGEPVYRSGEKYSPVFDSYDFNGPLLIESPLKYFFSIMLTWLGAVLISTEILRKIDGFKEDLLYTEDRDLFIRIALEHDFLFIPDVTFMHRQHGKSHSKRETSPREWPIKSFKSLLHDPKFRPHHKMIRWIISEWYMENYKYHDRQHRRIRSLMDYVGHLFFKYL